MATSKISCELKKTFTPSFPNEKFHNFIFEKYGRIVTICNVGLYLSDEIAVVPSWGEITIGTITDADYIPHNVMNINIADNGKFYYLQINPDGKVKVMDRTGNGLQPGQLIGFFGGAYISMP